MVLGQVLEGEQNAQNACFIEQVLSTCVEEVQRLYQAADGLHAVRGYAPIRHSVRR